MAQYILLLFTIISISSTIYSHPLNTNDTATIATITNNTTAITTSSSVSTINFTTSTTSILNRDQIINSKQLNNPLIPPGYYIGPKCKHLDDCNTDDMGHLMHWKSFLWFGIIPPIRIRTKKHDPIIIDNPYLTSDIYSQINKLDLDHILIRIGLLYTYVQIPINNIQYRNKILYIKHNNISTPVIEPNTYYIKLPHGLDFEFAAIMYIPGNSLRMVQINCTRKNNSECEEFITREIIKHRVLSLAVLKKNNNKWISYNRKTTSNSNQTIVNTGYACFAVYPIVIIFWIIAFHIIIGDFTNVDIDGSINDSTEMCKWFQIFIPVSYSVLIMLFTLLPAHEIAQYFVAVSAAITLAYIILYYLIKCVYNNTYCNRAYTISTRQINKLHQYRVPSLQHLNKIPNYYADNKIPNYYADNKIKKKPINTIPIGIDTINTTTTNVDTIYDTKYLSTNV